jgi:hypothetical protein
MRDLILLFLAMTLGLTAPAPGEPTTQSAQHEFTSPQYKIRLKYPADWTAPDPPLPGDIFSAQPPEPNRAMLNLRIDHAPPGAPDSATLVDLTDSMAGAIFKNGGEHVIIKPQTLGALPARRISFEKQGPADRVKGVYVVAVKDRVEYVFNFTASVQAFDSLLPAMNDLLNSFELLD